MTRLRKTLLTAALALPLALVLAGTVAAVLVAPWWAVGLCSLTATVALPAGLESLARLWA